MRQQGFGTIELLISLTVIFAAMAGVAGMLIENSKLNKSQQLRAQVQADARNCLAIIVQKVRSAGWDPRGISFDPVTLDPDGLDDGIAQLDVRADLNDDGDLDDDYERLQIRHANDVVEWRRAPDMAFEPLALNITNDADADGTVEPMFVPDADPPTRIAITITAESAKADPATGEPFRYTVTSDVVLRKEL